MGIGSWLRARLGRRAVTAAPIARNRELEAAIAADRDSDAPYLVYADWLQERGDPRGELIAVQIANTRDQREIQPLFDREAALFDEHFEHLRGPCRDIGGVRVVFRRGFVHRLDIVTSAATDAVLAALAIEHPATRFLAIVCPGNR